MMQRGTQTLALTQVGVLTPDGTSTTTEDLTWSPPVSRMIGMAGTAMTTHATEESTHKTSPGSETRMEDKAAARRRPRIPLRQRTTRRTVFYTRILKRA